MRRSKRVALLALAAAGATAAACNKASKDADKKAAETATAKVGTVSLETNPVAASYPEGLSISAFASTDDATVTLDAAATGTVAIEYAGTSLLLSGEPATPQGNRTQASPLRLTNAAPQCFNSYAEALAAHPGPAPDKLAPGLPPHAQEADAAGRINGKASSCLADELAASLDIMKELIKKSGQGLDGYGDCFMPDWGIVNGFYPNSQDVCMVGYARSELRKLSAYVDFAKGLSASMLCQALKDGVVAKPLAPGDSLDLTASLRKALNGGLSLPIKTAKLTRLAGDKLDYLTELTVAPNAELGGQAKDLDVTIAIDHKPADATNQTYAGIVRIAHASRGGEITAGTFALSVDYARSVDATGSRIKYELRSGVFADGGTPFGDGGVVDFNTFGKAKDSTGKDIDNDRVANMNYASYDGYPDIDVAKLSYWVNFGGHYGEPARGMVFDVKRVDNQVKGCAVGGATSIDAAQGYSIRRSIAEGYAMLPVGYLRPFQCNDMTGAKMWLQCFYRDDSGNFVPDPELIADTAAGFDFVASSVVESKVPTLADVPRPPRFTAGTFLPPPGAPVGPHMDPPPPPPGPN